MSKLKNSSGSNGKKNPNPLIWKTNPLPGQNQYINSVSIAADGSKLVAGTYFFDYSRAGHTLPGATTFTVGVFAYDKSETLLWKDEFQATEGVYWVSMSRDSAWSAAGGLELHGQGFIFIYNSANGNKPVTYNVPARTNMVALNTDGSYLVAGADALYVFTRAGAAWNAVPQKIPCVQALDTVISVAISSDGTWIIAGTLKGSVMLFKNTGGNLSQPVSWQLPGSVHWVAMAASASAFVVGGSKGLAYYFDLQSFLNNPTPKWSGALTGCNTCRSVAISDDGSLISAVANKGSGGIVFVFDNTGHLKWSQPTTNNPNSTSIDSLGKFVTMADGYPDGKPGSFYLFDNNGNQLWNYPSGNMSWPMEIAANSGAIVAASDDSNIYYFS